jgi:heat shock protein HslJ
MHEMKGVGVALWLAFWVAIAPAHAQQSEFPFDGELILDVDPMPGPKRIPYVDIGPTGAIAMQMWCNRVNGQVVVAGDTITVMTGPPSDLECPPERAQGDADLLAALGQVTNWRRDGDYVMLIGPKTLRFRLPTN